MPGRHDPIGFLVCALDEISYLDNFVTEKALRNKFQRTKIKENTQKPTMTMSMSIV